VIAAQGLELEEMGIEEAAEGLARQAASEALAERSEQLAVAGALLGIEGVAEVETVLEEADLAREIGMAGVTDIAEGTALLGAAHTAKSGK
jgi:hypothetical protein